MISRHCLRFLTSTLLNNAFVLEECIVYNNIWLSVASNRIDLITFYHLDDATCLRFKKTAEKSSKNVLQCNDKYAVILKIVSRTCVFQEFLH